MMACKGKNAGDKVQGKELQEDWKMLGHWPIGLRHPLTVDEIVALTADTLDPRVPPMSGRALEILRQMVIAEYHLAVDIKLKQHGTFLIGYSSLEPMQFTLDDYPQTAEDTRPALRKIAETAESRFGAGTINFIAYQMRLYEESFPLHQYSIRLSGI